MGQTSYRKHKWAPNACRLHRGSHWSPGLHIMQIPLSPPLHHVPMQALPTQGPTTASPIPLHDVLVSTLPSLLQCAPHCNTSPCEPRLTLSSPSSTALYWSAPTLGQEQAAKPKGGGQGSSRTQGAAGYPEQWSNGCPGVRDANRQPSLD